jgi:PAS domain S-box-containing protein
MEPSSAMRNGGTISFPSGDDLAGDLGRLPAEWSQDDLTEAQAQRIHAQEMFEFAPDGYLITDLEGVIGEVNHAAASLLGTRKDFLIGMPLGMYMTEEHTSLFYGQLARLIKAERLLQWEAALRGRKEPCEVMVAAAVLPDKQGEPARVRWTLRDISLIRRAERALLAEKSLADSLVEMADVLILIADARGRILRGNPFLWNIAGYHAHELRGRDWCEVLVPAEHRAAAHLMMNKALLEGAGRSDILRFAARGGEPRFVSWSARSMGGGLLLVGHDVTELHEAQRQALQTERLAAIGQMVAGLAHESRNALQRSQACLSMLCFRLKDQPETLELLEGMQKAQDDLKRLLDDVRSYAITPRLRIQNCDLRRTWREAWADLGGLPDAQSADLREDPESMDFFCHADPFLLKQVFRNLLENALACGASPLRVGIRCRSAILAGREAIQVSVSDNGPGFGEERDKVFEPFFTTKLRGTGLGLAICRRIIEAHNGRIEAGEGPAPGAEVVITLPRRGT